MIIPQNACEEIDCAFLTSLIFIPELSLED